MVYIHARATKQRGHFWFDTQFSHFITPSLGLKNFSSIFNTNLLHGWAAFVSVLSWFLRDRPCFRRQPGSFWELGVARWRETCRNMTPEEQWHKHCCPAWQICACLSVIIKHLESFFLPQPCLFFVILGLKWNISRFVRRWGCGWGCIHKQVEKGWEKSRLKGLYEVSVTLLEQTQFTVRNNELYH